MDSVDVMQQSMTLDASAARILTQSTMNPRSSHRSKSEESFENRSLVRTERLEEEVKKIIKLLGHLRTEQRTI